MTAKKEVIKHSAAIQITGDLSFVQRKNWNILLAHAFDDLPKKDVYTMEMKDLKDSLKYQNKNTNLKGLIEALQNTNVK